MTPLRAGIWLPPFDGLADPVVMVDLAVEAEAAGWDGVFLWDHVRWREPVRAVADPWVTLAAVAVATERVRLGPMVTPLARRRPVKVARETASLDQLSRGRLTLGVGLGADRFGEELSRTGEELDDRRRAEMLDEHLAILDDAWSGEPVRHRGPHYTVDDVRFLPRPVQPRVPVWAAAMGTNARPLRRAAGRDGVFSVNLGGADELAEVVARLTAVRAGADDDLARPYDVAVELEPEQDPAPWAAAGATWVLVGVAADAVDLDRVRGAVRAGPPTA